MSKDHDVKNSNYYYIDESGSIGGDSPLFIHGVIITDSPNLIEQTLQNLKTKIDNSAYFEEFSARFKEEGFHAVDNHFDIRAAFYQELVYLDWTAYLVIFKKDSDKYRFINKGVNSHVFKFTLFKVLRDRLIKRRGEKNHLVLESIDLQGQSLESIVNELQLSLKDKVAFTWDIKGKDELNLGTIDYVNYIIFKILTSTNKDVRMEQTFRMLASKIAVIHFPHNNVYLTRGSDQISVDQLKNQWRSLE